MPVPEVQRVWREWFAQWGLPEELRLDNGCPWGGWFDLPTALERYRLPDPPVGAQLVAAVRESLDLADGETLGRGFFGQSNLVFSGIQRQNCPGVPGREPVLVLLVEFQPEDRSTP